MGVRVGVIGAGTMGRRHLQALSTDLRVEIVGVADAVDTTARDAAASVGARPCGTLAELADLGAEAVFITLPNIHHAQLVLEALDRRLHVFSEKPMATSLADARRIVERVKASDRVYQMGFNRRWSPAYRYLKDEIHRGFVPFSASVKINDGDAMLLRCRGDRPVAFTTCGHASWAAPQERVELYGDHSLLVSEDLDRVRRSTRQTPHVEWQKLPSADQLSLWGYVEEDRAFIAACLGEAAPLVTVKDAFHSIAVLEAAYTSITRGGVPITVPQE